MNIRDSFRPGEPWFDTDGNLIQAHAGGFLFHEGVYYWYGEDKDGETLSGPEVGCGFRVDVIGVRCYSSTDLYNWKNEGLVLPAVKDDPDHDLHPSKVVERPKVIWNVKTQQFVMWMHIDDKDYGMAKSGIAVSPSPVGPFNYLGSIKPNDADCRDMTLYQEDGKAWLLHSSEWNKTLYISELTDDYLGVTGKYTRNFINCSREAPAVFKHLDSYFIISSGCTGWSPNPASYAVARDIMGPWETKNNPCIGEGADTSFRSQPTFVIPTTDRASTFILASDRHIKEDLRNSRYIWLPIEIDGEDLRIRWHDEWKLKNDLPR